MKWWSRLSDPPKPPGQVPDEPDPDAPVPVEEPPHPIPVPPIDLPPEPLRAWRDSGTWACFTLSWDGCAR